MAEFNSNLWAPWRMEYIRSLGDEQSDTGCFLCRYQAEPDRDSENHVVWRTPSALVVMNRFPYTNGHLLVAHAAHKAELTDLSDEPESTFELDGPDSRRPGSYAANCILARRLAERDVRFIQLFHPDPWM